MKNAITQLVRYAIVGGVSNAVGYLLYIGMTTAGVEFKLAMTILYAVGVAQTFVFNKRWTFGFPGRMASSLVRYVAVYVVGYIFNYVVLFMLVDRGGVPHQWVMAGLFVFMALYFFLAQKFWVFRFSPNVGMERVP